MPLEGSLLVVDDEPAIAKYMGLVLGRAGFQVLTAFNAEEGWEPFRRATPPVRAVVTDLAMPGDWNRSVATFRGRSANLAGCRSFPRLPACSNGASLNRR